MSPRAGSSPRDLLRRGLILGVGVGVPVVALSIHAAFYWPFVADDALISLRYSQRLLDGQGLTWTDGEPVEGYSNLLWVLGCAGLGLTGLDLIAAARLAGAACHLVVILAIHRMRPAGRASDIAAWAGGMAFASSGAVAVWTIGGMEQPLLAACLALSLARMFAMLEGNAPGGSGAPGPGWALAFLCLTRPDGPLLVAVLLAGCVFMDRSSMRRWIPAALLPCLAVLGQLAFRLVYYHDWVPNTAHLKISLTASRIVHGLDYVGGFCLATLPLLGLAAVGSWAGLRGYHRRRVALLVPTLFVWGAYVVFIGGDIFPAHRHMVPAVLLLALLASVGVGWILEEAGRPGAGAGAGLVLLLLGLFAGSVERQLRDPANRRARDERWEWDGKVIGELLGRAFARQRPLHAVTAAGCLPYFSRLPSLDLFGLNDRHIARQEPVPGAGIGHDRGDGHYVLGRRPDLITFHLGGPPAQVPGERLREIPRFWDEYLPVTFVAHDPRRIESLSWVRKEGRIGLGREPDRVIVPAYLLEGSTGILGPDDTMWGHLPAGRRLSSRPFDLGAGHWELVPPDRPDLEAGLRTGLARPVGGSAAGDGRSIERRGASRADAGGGPPAVEGSLHVDARTGVTLEVRTGMLAVDLDHFVIVRAGSAGRSGEVGAGGPSPPPGDDRVMEIPLGPGWDLEGEAMDHQPVRGPVSDQLPLTGHPGPYLDSYHPVLKDRARGSARSPGFSIPPRGWLEFFLGGGSRDCGARLWVDDRVVHSWSGEDREYLRPIRIDLSPWARRRARLEYHDRSGSPWGHVLGTGPRVHRIVPLDAAGGPPGTHGLHSSP